MKSSDFGQSNWEFLGVLLRSIAWPASDVLNHPPNWFRVCPKFTSLGTLVAPAL